MPTLSIKSGKADVEYANVVTIISAKASLEGHVNCTALNSLDINNSKYLKSGCLNFVLISDNFVYVMSVIWTLLLRFQTHFEKNLSEN